MARKVVNKAGDTSTPKRLRKSANQYNHYDQIITGLFLITCAMHGKGVYVNNKTYGLTFRVYDGEEVYEETLLTSDNIPALLSEFAERLDLHEAFDDLLERAFPSNTPERPVRRDRD